MVFDKHSKLGSKWEGTFCAKGYYVSTVGNITDDAIKSIFRNKKKKTKKKKQSETK